MKKRPIDRMAFVEFLLWWGLFVVAVVVLGALLFVLFYT